MLLHEKDVQQQSTASNTGVRYLPRNKRTFVVLVPNGILLTITIENDDPGTTILTLPLAAYHCEAIF